MKYYKNLSGLGLAAHPTVELFLNVGVIGKSMVTDWKEVRTRSTLSSID